LNLRLQHIVFVVLIAGFPLAAVGQNGGQPERPDVGEALRSGDLQGAARSARELADAGDVEGQYKLSLFFWHGVALTQNFEEAIRWSTLAAIRGHKKATAARRQMATSLDPALVLKAMDWSRARLAKSAEGGDDDALLALAASYSAAFGAPNDIEAYYWNVLAVAAGKAEARRQRDALVSRLKQADLLKTQQRANDWHGRFRAQKSERGVRL
jgi:hypothetical protein